MFRLLLQVGETGALEWESRAIGSHPKRPTVGTLKATTHKARRGGLHSFSAWTLPSGSKDARVQLAVGCG